MSKDEFDHDDFIKFEYIDDDVEIPVIAIAKVNGNGYSIQSMFDDPLETARIMIALGEDIINRSQHGSYT